MINMEIMPLLTLKDRFEQLADIAEASVGLEKDKALAGLSMYAARGVDCLLVTDGDETVGYLLFGPDEKFVPWLQHMKLKMHLVKQGVRSSWTICHLHLLPQYLKRGITARMSVAYCKEIVRRGGTHLLMWGYATDELANYALAKPGGRVFDGFTDSNGRPVGVRDLMTYLKAVEKQT